MVKKVSAGLVAALSVASSLLGLGLGVPAAYAALSEAGVVTPNVDVVARPVDDLMNAWSTLDTETYEAQWHPEAVQAFGNEPELRLGDILARRRSDFDRLAAVRVDGYRRCVVASDGPDEITLRVAYEMTIYWPEGDRIRTREDVEDELFVVRFNNQARRYQIFRNTDSPWGDATVCTLQPPDANGRTGWLPWLLG